PGLSFETSVPPQSTHRGKNILQRRRPDAVIESQPRFAVLQMRCHGGNRRLATGSYGLKQRGMFVMRAGSVAWRLVDRDNQRCARNQLLQKPLQYLIAGDLRQLQMKCA